MIEFIDKTSEQSGTPINRENMMGIQGFINENINVSEKTIIKTQNGQKTTTTFNAGVTNVTEVLEGTKRITKTIKLTNNGWEVRTS